MRNAVQISSGSGFDIFRLFSDLNNIYTVHYETKVK